MHPHEPDATIHWLNQQYMLYKVMLDHSAKRSQLSQVRAHDKSAQLRWWRLLLILQLAHHAAEPDLPNICSVARQQFVWFCEQVTHTP